MRFQERQATIEDTLHRMWPVGCIYPSVSPTNPAELFGFGTWVAFGVGRAIVGVDPADPDFDAAEKTSGAKTVTLTEAQMPSHTHLQNPHSHVETVNTAATGPNVGAAPDASTNTGVASGYSTQPATAVNQNTGGGQPHNNLQPSVAVFLFKRVS